ncbi:hypothetical protein [Pseudobacteriovorax antillogorgiicola]|uniref:Uncharacterized protein n=1 Tax=Pseudobacteriovorax antillogorgiicola TaxID=1513793 RepID=A0A1Y6BCQ5_9BACT|nr:hypothetical protein [Pseudobacteriovorax antillogorgiicola]TCS58848.1 hypothetical protein EDD56_102363 [Pseudobacteriovorax antillogorgiicola]SME94049.1 hypothetical protein SAMN06296036_10280 [Pseudobacteriovorax antillogorgiicola]
MKSSIFQGACCALVIMSCSDSIEGQKLPASSPTEGVERQIAEEPIQDNIEQGGGEVTESVGDVSKVVLKDEDEAIIQERCQPEDPTKIFSVEDSGLVQELIVDSTFSSVVVNGSQNTLSINLNFPQALRSFCVWVNGSENIINVQSNQTIDMLFVGVNGGGDNITLGIKPRVTINTVLNFVNGDSMINLQGIPGISALD